MAPTNLAGTDNISSIQLPAEANASAVSWSAILAGAAAAAVFSLILFLLGTGLGLSSISPWASRGASAAAIADAAIVWIIVTQVLASGLGGYLAGRLRTKWAGVHGDEVYFRDTAHGFLTWTLATLVVVALLSSVISGIVSGGAKAGAALTGVAAATGGGMTANAGDNAKSENSAGAESGPMGYFVDSLFRQDPNTSTANSTDASSRNSTVRNTNTAGSNSNSPSSNGGNPAAQKAATSAEVSRIFINSMTTKTLPSEDVTYVGQLVSKQTGLSQQDAEQRVNDVYASLQKKISDAKASAKEAADKARKATVYATLWLFVSLLIGAFTASWAATCGGRCRDGDLTQPNR